MNKKRMGLIFGALAFVVLMTAGASQGFAQTIDYTLGRAATGAYTLPGQPGPYVDVTVDRTSNTTATLTFTSLSNGGNTYLLFDGATADANINASSFSVSSVGGTWDTTDGFIITTLSVVSPPGSTSVDNLGDFNLTIYDPATGCTAGTESPDHSHYACGATQVVVSVTAPSANWLLPTDVLTAVGNGDGNMLAAHVDACVNNPCTAANLSTYTPKQGYVTTPEPGTPTLLLSGLFGLGLVGLGRRLLG